MKTREEAWLDIYNPGRLPFLAQGEEDVVHVECGMPVFKSCPEELSGFSLRWDDMHVVSVFDRDRYLGPLSKSWARSRCQSFAKTDRPASNHWVITDESHHPRNPRVLAINWNDQRHRGLIVDAVRAALCGRPEITERDLPHVRAAVIDLALARGFIIQWLGPFSLPLRGTNKVRGVLDLGGTIFYTHRRPASDEPDEALSIGTHEVQTPVRHFFLHYPTIKEVER